MNRYDEAVSPLMESITRSPKALVAHSFLAASYGQLGRMQDAQPLVSEILERKPKFSVASWGKGFKFKYPTDLEHYLDGLTKAGLPE